MIHVEERDIPETGWRVSGALVATCLLYLTLVIPNHPAALTPSLLLVFPLELPVILLLLAMLPARSGSATLARVAIVVCLVTLTILKLADFATFSTYNRGFNPLVDLHLIPAAWNLGSGTVGTLFAGGVVLAVLGAAALLIWLLWWATGRIAVIEVPASLKVAGVGVVIASGAVAVAEIGDAMRRWSLPFDMPGAAFTARVAVERTNMIHETFTRLQDFRSVADADPFAGRTPLLNLIGTEDVLVTYLESYGASSLTNPRYAPTHLATLARIQSELEERGLAMLSGWLEAPIIGGQSWLSHATLATGLWIPDQRTYGAALISGRRSLFHLAQENGFETVAVMPAITMDWPEADFMGFDRILAARDLGYAGLPFNWVTMPDQFTLSALERLVLSGEPGLDRAPVFAQVALISSHAPWTPVPDLIAWEDVGDGRIFDAVAQSGDPPEVVWRDRERVRDQFRQAIDYSLRTVGDYALRHAENPPLLIVLGDHQPALFVSEDEGLAVPIHVIGSNDLVDRLADWGWRSGLIPDPDTPPIPMDAFRNRFLTAFSDPVPGP